jgi:outer membrane protein OmpA-like peptidoglycan-associated protein
MFLLPAGSCVKTTDTSTTGLDSAAAFADPLKSEHQDRRGRLERLSSISLKATPSFYEYLIQAKDLPGIGVDMPVLRVVFEERVFFDTGRWEVRPDAQQVLDVVAKALRQEPREVALFVAGHTDVRGSEEYNLDLSVRRASSVGQALLRRGVGRAGIWRVGFGKAVPLRPNDTEANMAFNRRVEFLMANKPAAVAVWLAKQADTSCKEDPASTDCGSSRGSFTAAPVVLRSVSATANRPKDDHFKIDLGAKTFQVEPPQSKTFEVEPPRR